MRVIILGSGESCLSLSKKEKLAINESEVRIAVNKFALFNNLVGLDYTHIYFNDIYGLNVYIEIIKSLKNRSDITVITNSYLSTLTYSSFCELLICILSDLYYRCRSMLIAVYRLGKPGRSHELIIGRSFHYYQISKQNNIDIIKTTQWDDIGAPWAASLDEPLFSFRGSLMSVLNYVSVKFPKSEIVCVGTDFNGSRYFYEEELAKSGIDHEDHTTNEVKRKGIHYSFHDISQGKLSDAFPKALVKLASSGISISCNNAKSLLVKQCKVRYKELLND